MYSIDNKQKTRVANVIRVNFNIEPHWYNVKRIVEIVERGKFAVIITHKAQNHILRIAKHRYSTLSSPLKFQPRVFT